MCITVGLYVPQIMKVDKVIAAVNRLTFLVHPLSIYRIVLNLVYCGSARIVVHPVCTSQRTFNYFLYVINHAFHLQYITYCSLCILV